PRQLAHLVHSRHRTDAAHDTRAKPSHPPSPQSPTSTRTTLGPDAADGGRYLFDWDCACPFVGRDSCPHSCADSPERTVGPKRQWCPDPLLLNEQGARDHCVATTEFLPSQRRDGRTTVA